MTSILDRFTIEKSLIYVLILAVLMTFGIIFYLFFGQFTKNIQITAPAGGEEWETGQIYKVTWKARNIDKVGIVLFKGQEPQWIAKNISASLGSFEWKIYPGQQYGSDYWVAIFEYPWQKGNRIAYSNGSFAIVFPERASCDGLSIQNEWPYIPSDLPNLRKVFITESTYNGNLEGLEGADKKCQEEAQKQNFTGAWHAFLGGDSEQAVAVERIKKTPRKTEGIFIEAKPAVTLIRGATCHRLLGRNFDEFLMKFSNLSIINEQKFEDSFIQNLDDIWLGRIDEKSKKNCTSIAALLFNQYVKLFEKYSYTTSCQNWARGEKSVQGYPVPTGQPKPQFPECYTPEGRFTDAVASGGLATGLIGEGLNNAFTPYQGKSCDSRQHLLCIEE